MKTRLSLFCLLALMLAPALFRHFSRVREAGAEVRPSDTAVAAAPAKPERTFQRSALPPLSARIRRADSLMEARSALAEAGRGVDSIQQGRAQAAIIASLDNATLRDVLESIPGEDLAGELGGHLIEAWAGRSPADAVEWLQARGTNVPPSLLALATGLWTRAEPMQAVIWAEGLVSGSLRDVALQSVSGELMRSHPQESLRLALLLPDDEVRRELITRAVSEWAVRDGPSAVQWMAQVGEETLRRALAPRVAVAMAEFDPANAARLAIDELLPGQEQEQVIVQIVQRWVQQDPVATQRWVSQFPTGNLRDTAWEQLRALWPVN